MAAPTHMPVRVRPLMAWAHTGPSHGHGQQFTHAVLPGRHLAACGAVVAVVGEPWPDPPATTPEARCPICTQAVYGAWTGMDNMRGTPR